MALMWTGKGKSELSCAHGCHPDFAVIFQKSIVAKHVLERMQNSRGGHTPGGGQNAMGKSVCWGGGEHSSQ